MLPLVAVGWTPPIAPRANLGLSNALECEGREGTPGRSPIRLSGYTDPKPHQTSGRFCGFLRVSERAAY